MQANKVKKERKIPRHTYLHGMLIGKYRGEVDYAKKAQKFFLEKYYNIELYEAELHNCVFRRSIDGPFEFQGEKFPGHIPSPLHCQLKHENVEGYYTVQLYEVKLKDIEFSRELHLEEDDMVFGTLTATFTGYLQDELTEEYEEDVIDSQSPEKFKNGEGVTTTLHDTPYKTSIKTGNIRQYENYWGEEFWYSDYKSTYWTNTYTGSGTRQYINSGVSILQIIFALLFFAAVGHKAFLVLLAVAAIITIIALFSELLQYLLGAVMVILFLSFLASLFSTGMVTKKALELSDEPTETRTKVPDSQNKFDSLIVHHREWTDYDNNHYSGNIWVHTSTYANSHHFKNSLPLRGDNQFAYDNLLGQLYHYDSAYMQGIYQLFDSIRINVPDNVKFSEAIVSFVQDIPYSLILDNNCDASLYSDSYIKQYLEKHEGDCQGNERFGIQTPAEFIATLKGDCDTRTLFLYTILTHYNYDVAIMSSETYSHSIVAVDIPVSGKSIFIGGKRYVVWETTYKDIKAGLLPEEISDFDNWRISLIANKKTAI